MNSAQIASIIGFMAAGLGIVMFLPQAIRVWRTKDTKSISLASFLLLDFSSLLWTTYGLLLGAAPIILVNVVLLILSTFIVAMKIKYG